MNNNLFISSAVLLLGSSQLCHATQLSECQELEKTQASLESRYVCWKSLAIVKSTPPPVEIGLQKTMEPTPAKEPTAAKETELVHPTKGRGKLIDEWDPEHKGTMTSYKQSYLLFAQSSTPNNQPTSPNINNQVPFSALQNNDLKFQFSFKGRLIKWGNENSIWLAYTQLSYWQFFDTQNSRPFRESTYEPEVIWSHQYSHTERGGIYQYLRMVNGGIVHQSDGQSNPRSRSWNRAYLQVGFEQDCENGDQIILQPKIWARVFQEKDVTQNDNPDITHYLGYGELQFRYLNYDAEELNYQFSALAKMRSLQFDLDKHISGDFRLHLQYFKGYGESLLDYNHKNTTWGVGLSLPY